jgi:radical SAM/Cys-rich protein
MDLTPFPAALHSAGLKPLAAANVTWLQVNVGKLCNQACHHCHVGAGPKRTEIMSESTARRLVDLMKLAPNLEILDLTGGAPELNPSFRMLVRAASDLNLRIIDRCNLSVLFEPGQEDLVEFLASHRVEVTASLPCYLESNVDKQRGRGVFNLSIEALQRLNDAGYGRKGSGLQLDLVYNPVGAHLPPEQSGLEQAYRQELGDRFGIEFSNLITITNMPIQRFRDGLEREGTLQDYQALLRSSFNPETVPGLMCRSLISVGWDGHLYDCDFNQMLDLPLTSGQAKHIDSLIELTQLQGRVIHTASHCFGCTAGSGSSCAGSIS